MREQGRTRLERVRGGCVMEMVLQLQWERQRRQLRQQRRGHRKLVRRGNVVPEAGHVRVDREASVPEEAVGGREDGAEHGRRRAIVVLCPRAAPSRLRAAVAMREEPAGFGLWRGWGVRTKKVSLFASSPDVSPNDVLTS